MLKSPEKFVSIIIPAYRRPMLLDRLLRSVIQYTKYKRYEVIVVDDGSPNNEIENAISTFTDGSHLKINLGCIKNSENIGIAATRNAGINAAHGEMICQMDSDTIVSPDWLSKLLVAHERWTDNHAEAAITAALLSHQVGYFMCRPETPVNEFGLIQVASVGTACTIYRRKLIDEIGFYDKNLYNLWSDLDFCKRLGQQTERIKSETDVTPKIVIDPMTICYHHGWIDPATGVMSEQTDANTRSLEELNDREHKRRHLISMSIMFERWNIKHPKMDELQVELQNLD